MRYKFSGQTITLWDRLLSVATYYTMGMAGFIWLLVSWLVLRKPLNNFVSYHIYQSIFISLFLYIISIFYSIFYGLCAKIPFIGNVIVWFNAFFFETPIYFTFTLGNFIIFVIISWLALGALLGKYSYLPFVSDIINSNFRR